ncbi:MAG TPA: YIP1 family protein [Candidatus Limnocylindrales bacterium]|nr:YIP1 family protein [Candidatus Limnocylindrales bacterium]
MATTTAAVPETPQHIGAFGRVIGAIVNPRPTFEDIARKPSWLAPLLVMVILSIATTAAIGQRIGWRSFMEKQLSQNSRVQQMTPAQREKLIEQQTKFAPLLGYIGGAISFPVITLIVAAIFMGIFNAASSAGLDFKTSFGVITHSYMPLAIAALLGILILYLKPPDQIDIQNLVASNVGAFFSSDAPKWLQVLGASLDLFTFWVLALMAFAYSVVRPKKIRFGTGLTWIVAVWLVYVLVKVGFTAMFS